MTVVKKLNKALESERQRLDWIDQRIKENQDELLELEKSKQESLDDIQNITNAVKILEDKNKVSIKEVAIIE